MIRMMAVMVAVFAASAGCTDDGGSRTITAGDLHGNRPMIDLTTPGIWTVDGTQGAVDLTAIDVHTATTTTTAYDWLDNASTIAPDHLLNGKAIEIGGELSDDKDPGLRKNNYKDCELQCDPTGCTVVCVIGCDVDTSGTWHCPLGVTGVGTSPT